MSRHAQLLGLVVFCFCGINLLHSQEQQKDSTPAELLRTFKSMYVSSKTVYIKKGITEGALLKELQKKHVDLDIAIRTDASAEAVLGIERQAVWPQ